MFDAIDKITVAVSVSRLDLMALQKLSVISHALATTLQPTARREQTALVGVLDDLIRQLEIASRS